MAKRKKSKGCKILRIASKENPTHSVTYIGKERFNVFRESDEMDLGNHHQEIMINKFKFKRNN